MPRFRMTIEYDGRPYNGFQFQPGQPTVQGSLERAITAFSGEAATIHAAGRTDTGVHALGQVVHVDLERSWPARTVLDALNAHLAREAISILDAVEAPAGFHARFAAKGRRYLFRILDRRAPPALDAGRVWHVKRPLDAEAMDAAATLLTGHHDFTTFRDAQCQAKSPLRTLDEAQVWRDGEQVLLRFAARSFLHRQVRSMTGSLAQVGLGRWNAEDLGAALGARDRKACGPVAPPEGLYLAAVEY